jgi:signal transduction histidine kinase
MDTALMKPIDKATLKLSAIFTIVLTLISVGFSIGVYSITNHEMERDRPIGATVRPDRNPDFPQMIRERNQMVQESLVINLMIINVVVILVGAFGSYFLARYTLRPVKRNLEAQAEFVSDASHELRTPLAALAMENEVLLRNKSAGKAELTGQIESNLEEIDKLRQLTGRLLRLEAREKPVLELIDVRAAATEVCQQMAKTAANRQITIKNQVKKQKISAHRESLVDVLTILLDNAIKYSPAGSEVVVGNDADDLYVKDFGIGVSNKDLPRIFDRFYRGEKSRSSDGFGLGLPLAQRLAEQMGFKIIARPNVKSAGMTFLLQK